MMRELGNKKEEMVKLITNAMVKGICNYNYLKEDFNEIDIFAKDISMHIIDFSQTINRNKNRTQYSSSMLQLALYLYY